MDAPKPEEAPPQDDGRDDVQPVVPFDAVVIERRPPRLFDWIVFALVIAAATVWQRPLVAPLCFVLFACVFACRNTMGGSPDRRLGAVEAWAACVAFSVAVVMAFVVNLEYSGIFRTFDAPWTAAAHIASYGAMFGIGAAVAFALRRPTCVAGRRDRPVLDADFTTPLMMNGIGSLGAKRLEWGAFVVAAIVSVAAFKLPVPARISAVWFFAFPLALGWFGGTRIAVAVLVGALAATVFEPRLADGKNLAPLCSVVAIASGGLGALLASFARARTSHLRLGGDERIRLEIGGLGTRLERMTPRTERQFRISACIVLVCVSAAILWFALRQLPGVQRPGIDTLFVTASGIVVALGAVFLSTTVGPGIVAAFGLLVFVPLYLPTRFVGVPSFVTREALWLAPCAMLGAAVAMLVQQVGARVGATPLRSQRIVLVAALAGMLFAWTASFVWQRAWETEVPTWSFSGAPYGIQRREAFGEIPSSEIATPAAVALLAGLGGEAFGLPGLIAAIGFTLGLLSAALVLLGALAARFARHRGLDASRCRDLGIAIVLGEAVALFVRSAL